MTSKAENIQQMFTRIAPRYDLLNRVMSLSIDKLWRKKAVSLLSQKANAKILDLCAGTLDLTLEVLRQNSQAQVTALDFSEAMLKNGEKKIPEKYRAQVKTVVGDGMSPPLPDDFFDGMICGFGMRNIVDNTKALDEGFRMLKKGGKIVVLEFFRPTTRIGRLFYATYGKWVIPRLGRWLAGDAAYQYLFDSIQSYFSIEDYKKLIERTGFQSVQYKPLNGGVAYMISAIK